MSAYDGFHLIPNSEKESGLEFHFFSLENKEGANKSKDPIGGNKLGDLYNVLLMKHTEEGIELDSIFSAIFIDPEKYAENLLGTNIYGTFVKSSELCNEWWKHYVVETKKRIESINESGEV